MHEKYFNFLKQSLFSPQEAASVFFILIKYFDINELRKIQKFNELQNTVISLDISPQEIFTKVALFVVQKNNLSAIKFLIDECRYDLTEMRSDRNNATLLHEACLFGSKQLIQYLLQKGFLPNAQDVAGETPLHRVMRRNNSQDFIKLLKDHGADLNIQINNGLTALHIAAINKNLNVASVLIQFGAKETLTWDGVTYSALKKAIKRGIYQIKPPIISQPKESVIEKTLAEYYKGCLLPLFDKLIFQNVVKELLKVDKLSREDTQTFIQSMILINSLNSFQLKFLQKNLLLLIKQSKVTHSNAVLCVLKESEFFERERHTDIIEKFNFLALAIMSPEKISLQDQCNIYSVIGARYKKIGFLKESEHYLQLALEKNSFRNDALKSDTFFNLGCTQVFLMKDEAALNNFRSAFNLNKKDIVSFQRYVPLLLQCNQYEEALKVCSAATNFGRVSEIFAAYAKTLCGDSTWADLLEIVKEDSSDESAYILSLDLRSRCYLKCGNYDEALKASEDSFVLKAKRFEADNNEDIASQIFKILNILVQAKKYQEGLARLEVWEKSYSFELNNNVLYQGIATILYIINQRFNQAEDSIQKINKLGVDTNVLARIYFLLGIEVFLINPKNADTALNYINLALKLNPDYLVGQFYKLLLLISMENKTVAEETLKAIEPETLSDISLAKNVLKEDVVSPENIVVDMPVAETIVDSEKVSQNEINIVAEQPREELLTIENYDPHKIHEFFQAEKARLLRESMEDLSRAPQPKAKWKIGAVSFEEGKDGLIAIKHHSYSPCYAVIHPLLAVAAELRGKFQAALDKGTSARKSKNGVQTLNNAVVQIAIREEDRLYTTTIYRNAHDQYLIVFDKHGNHPEVKKRARTARPLELIPLATAEQGPQSIIPSDSIFVVPPPRQTNQQPLNKQISGIINPF